MPEISRFLGIVIAMFYSDHSPPHFHVRYSGWRATFALQPPRMLSGSLPPRVTGLVTEWATLHSAELEDDWQRARRREPLVQIPPLE